jgi:hypothetical protein
MKIGYVKCPAFGNEKIYFTQAGFNHLLRKGRKLREKNDQIRRLDLLQYAPTILISSAMYSTHEKRYLYNSVAHFWSFMYTQKGKSITVIIRQLNGSHKHFFSIFDSISL